MNHKVTLAVSAALMSMSVHSATQLSAAAVSSFDVDVEQLQSAHAISVNKDLDRSLFNNKRTFVKEKGLLDKPYTYIIHLDNEPVAIYDGGVEGLAATNPKHKLRSATAVQQAPRVKLDISAPEVVAYASYLDQQQASAISKVQEIAGSAKVLAQYKYALNGMAVMLTPSEAEAVSNIPGVKFVERDQLYTLDTDTGPSLIGAPGVWDGTANSGTEVRGEGVVVGIIDSGVNTDHLSFAATDADGYTHTNPLGDGVYLGDCAGDYPELCNAKLIGVYSYPVITDNYDDTTVFPVDLPENGEDYGGHGSHVAGTAAGNTLYDVPEVTPEFGVEESSGIPTGFEFDRISGVAPRANIVSYQVCFGGRSSAGDTYGDCPGAAIAAGIESALTDGVDVINYSISGGGNPWNSSTELAYLSARNAGIFVATSAGNGGPGAATTPKHAPWYTAVAASEHGRSVEYAKTIGTFTGGDAELADIDGVSNSGGITASIVYAGDYENPNSNDDPAQCLEPFPEGTFSGEIVVCDRGAIARVQKAINVSDGGAGGYVLANLQDGATSLNSDSYVVPGIHVSADDGDALKAWLAAGTGHTATITASTGELVIDDSRVDVLAGFSSKGPNSSISTLSPTITGPGVNIYAAYADQNFGHDGNGPAPSDYDYLSGTSMSSPHVAGAAALVKSAHPTWTPDNIRSALAMTAVPTIKKEDGVTAGDWFDMGSGRVQVDLAVQAGLVMDETAQNYLDANPAEGGDPRTLNLPSVTDDNCVGTCSWTRTVTATQDGTWTTSGATISTGLEITVSPAEFTLAAGESQEITVNIDAFSAESDVWSFGLVNLESDSAPNMHLPVSVIASNGNVPSELTLEAARNQDSALFTDLMAIEITDFQSTSYSVVAPTIVAGEVAQDSDNSSILDDLTDGLFITTVDVVDTDLRMVAMVSDSTAPDLDLWVVLDRNGDGIPTGDEVVGLSATASADERVDVMFPEAGMYWLIVQNWAASAEDAVDTFNLSYAVVDATPSDAVSITGPATVPQLTEFDVRMTYDLGDATEGDLFFSVVTMGTDADNADNLGTIPVDMIRVQDDVRVVTPDLTRVNPGDTADFAVEISPNFTFEDRDYEVSVTLPEGVALVDGSVEGNYTVDGDTITWMQSQPSLLAGGVSPYIYEITTNATDEMCFNPSFGPFTGEFVDLAAFGIGQQPFDGDGVAVTFGVGANFLGTLYEGVTITEDGYVTFGNEFGSTPWVNQLMPNEGVPNGVVAPFWRDMEFDLANGSGLRVATAGANFTFIQWDAMKPWGATGEGDLATFQIVFQNAATAAQPNIVMSYTRMAHNFGDQIGTSIGYEDLTGTVGATTHYRPYPGSTDAPIGSVAADAVNGLQVCFYEVQTPATQLGFSVTVDADNAGGPIQMMAMSQVYESGTTTAFPGTGMAASEIFADLQVEGPPVVLINGLTEANLEVLELTELDLPAVVTEPNGDTVDLLWKQVSGPAAVIAGNGIAEAVLAAPEVTEDTMIVLELTATDSNGNSVTSTANVMVLNNLAPELAISAPTSVVEGNTITISVSATDNEGDAVAISINGVAGSTYTTTAPVTNADMTMTFEVVATDGINTVTEQVSVKVTNKTGGSMGWIALLLIPAIWLRRKKMH